MSTTNLNHKFNERGLVNESFILRCFPENFDYNYYHYITIDFIEFVKNENLVKFNNFEKIIRKYLDIKQIQPKYRKKFIRNILLSGYTLQNIIDI